MNGPLANADLLSILAAIPLAALGGEAFLRGVLGVAAWLRVPNQLVATTLAAAATSSPELTVSTMAALTGKPGIGLGDALGSNVVNIAFIWGLALMLGAPAARLADWRPDFALALAVPVLTFILAADGTLSRAEGALLLALFAFWFISKARQGLNHRRDNDTQSALPRGRPLRACLFALGGLACLVLAGRLFVTGASGIASAMGVSRYMIGATVVALGTSLPELVTALLARWRGHDDVGLGTLLGSNLFNGLGIVGIAAAISAIRVPPGEIAVVLGFGMLSVLLIFPLRGALPRRRGFVLMLAYAAYIAASVSIMS